MDSLPVLGMKQKSSQEDWLRVWSAIRENPDKDLVERLVQEAADLVEKSIARVPRGRVGWLWSGGKDSLALQPVMERVGLTRAAGAITPLDWPEFVEWFASNAPSYVDQYLISKVNLQWLSERPDLLFPERNASRWFSHIQRRAESDFSKRHNIEVMIGGWRAVDGNHLGRGGGYSYRSKDHVRLGPIAQWSHEDLLHVLAVYQPDLPPIYYYPRGFPMGTGAWAARPRLSSLRESWNEVFAIAPEIVEASATMNLPGASATLRRI